VALAALDAGGSVIVPKSLADTAGIQVGDTMEFATGTQVTKLTVAGVVAHSIPAESQEAILVGWSDAVAYFGATGADFFAVRYEPGRKRLPGLLSIPRPFRTPWSQPNSTESPVRWVTRWTASSGCSTHLP